MTKKFKPKIKQPDDELKLLAWYRGKRVDDNEWVYGFYAAQSIAPLPTIFSPSTCEILYGGDTDE
jgi:hypothetical protein